MTRNPFTGLTVGTVYYVISAGLTANDFEVSATAGGSAINTSSAGSGTHSVTDVYGVVNAYCWNAFAPDVVAPASAELASRFPALSYR